MCCMPRRFIYRIHIDIVVFVGEEAHNYTYLLQNLWWFYIL